MTDAPKHIWTNGDRGTYEITAFINGTEYVRADFLAAALDTADVFMKHRDELQSEYRDLMRAAHDLCSELPELFPEYDTQMAYNGLWKLCKDYDPTNG